MAVAVIAMPLIIGAAVVGRLYFTIFVTIVVVGSVLEFYRYFIKGQTATAISSGTVAALSICLDLYYFYGSHIGVILFIFFVYESLYELFWGKGHPLQNIAIKMMGLLYCNLFSTFILIRELPQFKNLPYLTGGKFVLLVFSALWLLDTSAYLVGSSVKRRHLLHKRISPNKSWEGAIAGFIMCMITVSTVRYFWIPSLAVLDGLALGAIIGVFGQLSDLVESMFKRDANIKDSSKIIPGHGGILDRFDSSLLVTPIVYLYLFVIYIPKF